MSKPIFCLDFDGVCHSYTSGWKGATVIPDLPVDGLFEFLVMIEPYFDAQVFSSRSHQEGGVEAMHDWFDKMWADWCMTIQTREGQRFSVSAPVSFPSVKPAAFIGLDDRVLTFMGKWPTLQELREFTPWNKGEQKPDLRQRIVTFIDEWEAVMASYEVQRLLDELKKIVQ